jgi:5-methylcytosine-specific restriction endonuclease McrA
MSKNYSRSSLSRAALTRGLHVHVRTEVGATAEVLADLAEFDHREYYKPGYPSMWEYGLARLPWSPDELHRRLAAARGARQFPQLLVELAEERLHLTGMSLLAPHLTTKNCDKLIDSCRRKTKREIELLLAVMFPKSDAPTLIEAIPAHQIVPLPPALAETLGVLCPGKVTEPDSQRLTDAVEANPEPHADEPMALIPVQGSAQPGVSAVLVPVSVATQIKATGVERHKITTTLRQETVDLLKEAQALLDIPASDVDRVLHRALSDLVQRIKGRRYGLSDQPRDHATGRAGKVNERHVPAAIRRKVHARDGGRCTFVDERGCRCPKVHNLVYDHIQPIARGGLTTASNLRLLCPEHNQMEADRVFGDAFMKGKRERGEEAHS